MNYLPSYHLILHLPGQVLPASIHIAGTPCADFSVKGNQMAELGPTFVLFLCWCAQRLLLQESILIQENVHQFKVELLFRMLGKLYHVDTSESVTFGPQELGWGVQRQRRWTVPRHKYKTRAWRCPFNIFASLFVSQPWFGLWDEVKDRTPAWDIFFASSQMEQFMELLWGFSRPGCLSQCPFSTFDEFKTSCVDSHAAIWLAALTQTEQEHLSNYVSAGSSDCAVYQLNQNPQFVDTRSNWENLQTLIKNAGVLWCLGLYI